MIMITLDLKLLKKNNSSDAIFDWFRLIILLEYNILFWLLISIEWWNMIIMIFLLLLVHHQLLKKANSIGNVPTLKIYSIA